MTFETQLRSDELAEVRQKWGWLLGLGILLLVAGAIAFVNLLVATVASVYYIGLLMIIGGIGQLAHAYQVKGWKHTLFWGLSGVLYAVAGVLAFVNPVLTAAVLTYLLAIALLVAGFFRIWVGFKLRPDTGWGWVIAGGVITALAGLVIAIGWPLNSLFILGLFLAVDLISQGVSLIAVALALRKAPVTPLDTTAGPTGTN